MAWQSQEQGDGWATRQMEKSHAEERAVNLVISRWIGAKEVKRKGQRELQPDKPQLLLGPSAPRFGRRTTLMAAFRVMRDLKKRTRDLRRPQGQQTQKPGRCLLHHSRSGGFSDTRYLPVLTQRGNTEDFAPADKPAS